MTLRLTRRTALAGALALPAGAHAALPRKQDSRLQPAYRSDRVWNGVTRTRAGRTFVTYPSSDRPGVTLAELAPDGTPRPYPNAAWNAVRTPPSPDGAFICANALRIGPDGMLWVVDAGSQGIGKPSIKGGARLFVIDPAKDAIVRTIGLGSAIHPDSYIDDVRFNGAHAYVTDAGSAGLLVLELGSGAVRRVLDGAPSATDRRAMHADGKLLRDDKGREKRVQADQLEVSPDGMFLYFMPASGPMSRIETRLLDDASVTPDALQAAVQPFFDAPTSGGTCIDAKGTLYIADADRRRILAVTPEGKATTLIEDPRLIWVDAMWIDHDGWLWLPANQQNLTPGFNGGKMAVGYPVWIYKMQLGVGPAPNDHG